MQKGKKHEMVRDWSEKETFNVKESLTSSVRLQEGQVQKMDDEWTIHTRDKCVDFP